MAGRLGIGDLDYWSKAVEEQALEYAADEHPFSEASLAVLEELLQSVRAVASVSYLTDQATPRAMTRDEAIVAGLLTRCAKLQEGLLDPAINSRMELFSLVWRALIETAVNAIYLTRFGGPQLFNAYVEYSLRVEKQLLARVQADVEEQEGEPLPIQTRILDSIPRAFDVAGVSADEVDSTDRSDWSGKGGIYARFKAIGWQSLYAIFQIGSQYVHGNWHDLSVHHLARDARGGYHVAHDFTAVRCQPIVGAVKIVGSAAHEYLTTKVSPSDDRAVLEARIGACIEKGEIVEEWHDRYLSRG